MRALLQLSIAFAVGWLLTAIVIQGIVAELALRNWGM